MEITLIGDKAVDAALRDYPKKATRAIVRAMNRALTSGRTLLVQRIAADTGLKSGDIKKAMTVREASSQSLEARLGLGLKRIPLISFNARGPEPSRGRGRGVSYRLTGGSGRIPNAFIATMKSGHRASSHGHRRADCRYTNCLARRSAMCSRSIDRKALRG
jgi:hypothetical protein